jgi:hypothetical protein
MATHSRKTRLPAKSHPGTDHTATAAPTVGFGRFSNSETTRCADPTSLPSASVISARNAPLPAGAASASTNHAPSGEPTLCPSPPSPENRWANRQTSAGSSMPTLWHAKPSLPQLVGDGQELGDVHGARRR